MTVIITLLTVLGGTAFAIFRLMRTYKTNVELRNTVAVQQDQLKFQDEVIEDLTNRHTIDATINELRKGDF